jgi:hypothetical protein
VRSRKLSDSESSGGKRLSEDQRERDNCFAADTGAVVLTRKAKRSKASKQDKGSSATGVRLYNLMHRMRVGISNDLPKAPDHML